SHNADAIYKCACNEWYEEPYKISQEDYLNWCLEFCRQHRVDIFIPRRFMTIIADNTDKFQEIGTKLLAENRDNLCKVLNDKQLTYEYVSKFLPEIVPDYSVVHSCEEFAEAYNRLKTPQNRICYKLIRDEGAASFRVIDERVETAEALTEKPGFKVTLETAKKVLQLYDFNVPMLVMPYLSGNELSIDCLATPSGNIILPRLKSTKRYSLVSFKPEILQICQPLLDKIALKIPVNIQLKYEGSRPYLLEINPRMSGGLQLACKASGINLPSIAVKQLIGQEEKWQYPEFKDYKTANIETPICLP
ncbi:ATP-grasp domain-containing protein, partial [bacterium]|nr:ATP-grasp domain-containing protein [bacterium]